MTQDAIGNPTIEFQPLDSSSPARGLGLMPYGVAVMALLGTVLALRTGQWSYLAGSVAVAVIAFRRHRSRSSEPVSRRALRTQGRGDTARQRLTLTEDGLDEEYGGTSQTTRYSRIAGIEETAEVVSILVGEDAAYLVPRRRLTAGDLDGFVVELRERLKIHVLQDATRDMVTGDWSVLLPQHFSVLRAADSWQAHHDDRIAFVSSLAVTTTPGLPTTADALCATGARALSVPEEQRLHHTGIGHRGVAEVRRAAEGWQLKGFMCVDGSIATCVLDYREEQHAAWAEATWRSLQHSNPGSPAD